MKGIHSHGGLGWECYVMAGGGRGCLARIGRPSRTTSLIHTYRHTHTPCPSLLRFLSLLPPSLSVQVGRNICHGSDTVENAEREIKLWFGEGTIDWASHSQDWIYE